MGFLLDVDVVRAIPEARASIPPGARLHESTYARYERQVNSRNSKSNGRRGQSNLMSQIGNAPRIQVYSQDGFSSAVRITRSTIVCLMRNLPRPVRRLYFHLSAISFRYPRKRVSGVTRVSSPCNLAYRESRAFSCVICIIGHCGVAKGPTLPDAIPPSAHSCRSSCRHFAFLGFELRRFARAIRHSPRE